MRIKYKHRYGSHFISNILTLGIIVLFVFSFLLVHMAFEKGGTEGGILWLLNVSIVLVYIAFIELLRNIPVEIFAKPEELSVTVLIKETVIKYSDIESISIDHEFRKAEYRYEDDWYNEILTITDIYKNEYVYSRKLDLDKSEIAKDPANLTKQFENSKFSQLKRYIEEQMKL